MTCTNHVSNLSNLKIRVSSGETFGIDDDLEINNYFEWEPSEDDISYLRTVDVNYLEEEEECTAGRDMDVGDLWCFAPILSVREREMLLVPSSRSAVRSEVSRSRSVSTEGSSSRSVSSEGSSTRSLCSTQRRIRRRVYKNIFVPNDRNNVSVC